MKVTMFHILLRLQSQNYALESFSLPNGPSILEKILLYFRSTFRS